nr:hypothetical protein CFP56_12333 [Quercus suber]
MEICCAVGLCARRQTTVPYVANKLIPLGRWYGAKLTLALTTCVLYRLITVHYQRLLRPTHATLLKVPHYRLCTDQCPSRRHHTVTLPSVRQSDYLRCRSACNSAGLWMKRVTKRPSSLATGNRGRKTFEKTGRYPCYSF